MRGIGLDIIVCLIAFRIYVFGAVMFVSKSAQKESVIFSTTASNIAVA